MKYIFTAHLAKCKTDRSYTMKLFTNLTYAKLLDLTQSMEAQT